MNNFKKTVAVTGIILSFLGTLVSLIDTGVNSVEKINTIKKGGEI